MQMFQSNCIESTNGLFENSSWDTFRLMPPTINSYGTLQKLQIKHDNKNNRPGWFLGAVVVFNRSAGEQAMFYANRWLATGEGDKKIDSALDKLQAVYYAYKAPYELSSPWQHETVGVSKGKAWGNKSSGALGIYCDVWAGSIKALEQLCTIYDDMNLLANLETLANANIATRIVDTFSFNTTNGRNTVRVGLRCDASGIVTGSGFVIVGGAVAGIDTVGFCTPPSQPVQTQNTQATYTKITKTANDTREYPIYNRSWGWHQSHTYDLGSLPAIQSLSETIVAGPSKQKNITYTRQIRISNDGTKWTTIYTFHVPGGTSSSFSVSGISVNCRYVQIFTNGQGYVDDSTLTVN
ncbi:MAG TPA: PLAT/LH2 domain-containing protein [Spirochaetales bacterium]|nr:PLAT/LH2 domain-containing protein [Spirochaetales bacterium]